MNGYVYIRCEQYAITDASFVRLPIRSTDSASLEVMLREKRKGETVIPPILITPMDLFENEILLSVLGIKFCGETFESFAIHLSQSYHESDHVCGNEERTGRTYLHLFEEKIQEAKLLNLLTGSPIKIMPTGLEFRQKCLDAQKHAQFLTYEKTMSESFSLW